jgi:hypothetical protein
MKTTMTSVVVAVCVLFVSAMVRMQHVTFAERARRALPLPTSAAPASLSARPAPLAGSRHAMLASGETAR